MDNINPNEFKMFHDLHEARPANQGGLENEASEQTIMAHPENAESAESAKPSTLINSKVYQLLPELLKVECDKFDGKERDIFFLSILTLTSSVLENVYGDYSNRRVFPNLFLNITMNPGTGKGTMGYARDAGEILHKYLINEEPIVAQTVDEIAKKPKSLFIPGNSSTAALISCLNVNGGSGIMFESESDTLANAIKQEWGGFSDTMRKAFHHETISDNKNSGNGFVEINTPKLSVIISGTPNQIPQLLQGVGDGLVSRFLFYTSNSRPVWKSPFSKKFDSNYYKDEFGKTVLEIYKYYSTGEMMEFTLTSKQQQQFDSFFGEKTEQLKKCYSNEIDGSIFRFALITYRIMMVLTSIRYFRNKQEEPINLECSDSDFDCGLMLFDSLFDHTLAIFKLLPKRYDKASSGPEGKILSIFTKDRTYQTSEIIELTKNFNIKERAIKEYLSKMLEKGLLNKTKHGHYQLKVA